MSLAALTFSARSWSLVGGTHLEARHCIVHRRLSRLVPCLCTRELRLERVELRCLLALHFVAVLQVALQRTNLIIDIDI